MTDDSVKNFYKSKDEGYFGRYDFEHSSRLDFMVEYFNLKEIKNKRIVDFGVGAGNVFARLDRSNEFIGFDGADIPKKLVPFQHIQIDLGKGLHYRNDGQPHGWPQADVVFCCETAEHVTNVYDMMLSMKSYAKIGAPLYISFPDYRMQHPMCLPGVFMPVENAVIFLEQLAWIVEDKVLYNGNWPSWILKCVNRPMVEQRMLFPKPEKKFWGLPPHQQANI